MMGGSYALMRPLAVVVVALCMACAKQAPAEQEVGYNRQIRPLLSDRCFQCHGPDEGHREAGLRLDDRDAATSESDSGFTAIAPGNLSDSELIARITSSDPDLMMPPPESGKSLNSDEIALLQQWVEQGAEYQPHWAFVAPARPEPRPVDRRDWVQNPIDEFVLAKLEEHGLASSPEADRVTLLRRLTLDLIGLPPTVAEIKAFLADSSPEAYERAVDRLLASPRFGEHAARYWLDAVRYGDTHGLHLDNYREMWPYRDWVIRAFNDNLPWDQFTIMQVAGDMLPGATLDDKIASGFNRCHVTTNEGGSIAEEVYVRNVVDRVSTTGTVFLGLTMGCAVCHDHKFDPISSRDFYSTFAFFNNLDAKPLDGNKADHAPTVKAPSPQQASELASLKEQLKQVEDKLASAWPEIEGMQQDWEAASNSEGSKDSKPEVSLGTWSSVGPFRADVRYLYSKQHGPEGKPFDANQEFTTSDGEALRWKPQPDWGDGKVHDNLSQKTSATFLHRTLKANRDQTVTIGLGTDDGVKVYLNGKRIFQSDAPRSVTPDQDKLGLELKQGDNHLIMKIVNHAGRCGFCFTAPVLNDQTPSDVIDILATDSSERTAEQNARLQQFYRRHVCEHAEVQAAVEAVKSLGKKIVELEGQIPTTLVMKELAKPREAFVLLRGQYDSPDKELGPLARAVPSFLPPLPEGAPNNRLGFAQWLVAPEHPLMARVTVNRFWQQFFGTGIVETSDDFGSQGAWPSHPELLDWLAVDFRENGWDVKRLAKQIVMSNTYRQSSKSSPDLESADPQNRLLARGPRFRLDAEVIRDQALVVSGLLYNELGGPGVKPPQPDGLWKAVAYSSSNTSRFKPDTGRKKVHRRSIYTFFKRTAPPPQLSTLDAPSRESCVVRRERTNTPMAALMLLNDPQYVEAARKLAERAMLNTAAEPTEVAHNMLQLATLREPTDEGLQRLVTLYGESLQRYQSDEDAVNKLLGIGEAPVSNEIDRAELAAWTLAANVVLNLDEVLNKE